VTATDTTGKPRTPASVAVAAVEETIRQIAREPDDPSQPAPSSDPAGSADLLAALARLRAVQDRLAAWEPLLIGAARSRGASWAAIAPALGVASRQAAESRYLRLNSHAADPGGMTGEQRVQAARARRAGDRAVARWAHSNAATLRRLAAQVTALDDLDEAAQTSVDRVHHALGDDDSTTLLAPLAEAGPKLEESHPVLAGQIAGINTTTDQLRRNQATNTR
jgi:hypothetical protein